MHDASVAVLTEVNCRRTSGYAGADRRGGLARLNTCAPAIEDQGRGSWCRRQCRFQRI